MTPDLRKAAPIFDALYNAILVRQDERANVGESALEEMTISRDAYDRLADEAKSICIVRDPTITETRLLGVLIRRMGDA